MTEQSSHPELREDFDDPRPDDHVPVGEPGSRPDLGLARWLPHGCLLVIAMALLAFDYRLLSAFVSAVFLAAVFWTLSPVGGRSV